MTDKVEQSMDRYREAVKYFRTVNDSDEAKAWNQAQLSIYNHQALENTVEYALTDLGKRFPEFKFTACSSTTGPLAPMNIRSYKR